MIAATLSRYDRYRVLHNLVFGIILVFFVQWIFLGDLRSATIVAATIPFALFFAIGILVLRGKSANLLSVGAIDFGLIVDATVIMVENIYRHLGRRRAPEASPEPGRAFQSAVPHGFTREACDHLQGLDRGQSRDFLFRGHYYRGICAAVHL